MYTVLARVLKSRHGSFVRVKSLSYGSWAVPCVCRSQYLTLLASHAL